MFTFIVIMLILAVIGTGIIAAYLCEDGFAGVVAAIFATLVALIVGIVSSYLVGVCKDVSETEMIGYVSNVSYGGAVWKTVEVDVYIDKNTSSVCKSFSSPDAKYFDILKNLSGKKIKIKSKDSWVLPLSEGSSTRRIMSVEAVVENVEKNSKE